MSKHVPISELEENIKQISIWFTIYCHLANLYFDPDIMPVTQKKKRAKILL